MLRTVLTCLTLLTATLPAQAEERMRVEDFAALVTGKTLFFSRQNQPYGAEEYRPDRSVVWSFLDGQCLYGRWFEGADDSICFVYEDRPDQIVCWAFFQTENGDYATRVLGADPAND